MKLYTFLILIWEIFMTIFLILFISEFIGEDTIPNHGSDLHPYYIFICIMLIFCMIYPLLNWWFDKREKAKCEKL